MMCKTTNSSGNKLYKYRDKFKYKQIQIQLPTYNNGILRYLYQSNTIY